MKPTDHEAALQRYVRSPFNPARKQGFKAAVPPEAFEPPKEPMRADEFAILLGLLLGSAALAVLCLVKFAPVVWAAVRGVVW